MLLVTVNSGRDCKKPSFFLKEFDSKRQGFLVKIVNNF